MILSFVTKECNVFIRFDNGVGTEILEKNL